MGFVQINFTHTTHVSFDVIRQLADLATLPHLFSPSSYPEKLGWRLVYCLFADPNPLTCSRSCTYMRKHTPHTHVSWQVLTRCIGGTMPSPPLYGRTFQSTSKQLWNVPLGKISIQTVNTLQADTSVRFSKMTKGQRALIRLVLPIGKCVCVSWCVIGVSYVGRE